jgi:hypothetical protein
VEEKIGKYSFGIGDRFAHQGEAQLKAFLKAKNAGIDITPVWNKSNREHLTVGSKPESVRQEADAAVKALNWTNNYLVDADHITFDSVEGFLHSSDFFTIDVASHLGVKPPEKEREQFINAHQHLIGILHIDGIHEPFKITQADIESAADNFLVAVQEAKKTFDLIQSAKGDTYFSIEVSMDEVEAPQTPLQLYLILYMLSEFGVRVNTIAPKFSGKFNKGVDYVGDLEAFEKEFEQDVLVLNYAKKHMNFSQALKLSVHSGSDKFSLYPIINKLIKKHDAGLHLKTAGTTWLEELIGLSGSEGTGLTMAKEIYKKALDRYDELTKPYAMALDIDKGKLLSPHEVDAFTGEHFARIIRHNRRDEKFNPHVRQLLHTSYKIAAEFGGAFTSELTRHRANIEKHVMENIYERHMLPLFQD